MRRAIPALTRLIGLAPDDTVFLEGGLGSQLMGMMIYRLRSEQDPATKCDVTYFFPEIREPEVTDGATRWPWELHRYGFNLHDEVFVRSPRYRFRRDYRAQAALDQQVSPGLSRHRWTEVFPIVPQAIDRSRELELNDADGYACIHVRRGDYLKVSSRVVTLEESLAMAVKIAALLPRRVLFLSDDEYTLDEQRHVAASLRDKDCLFVSESDQHVAHGLLRMSRVLITSNSTFSWTASLMMSSSGALALAPEHFFGPSMASNNNVFQGPANWMVISQSA